HQDHHHTCQPEAMDDSRGDKAALKTARANLSHGIKKEKHQYAQKINNNFSDSKDTR
ncbi:hypothetical protein M9458_008760, partial [Cirrhinus mrigala]